MTYKILQGHVLDKINELKDNSINLCITSPPYWGLRDYGEDTNTVIWDGKVNCKHEWDNNYCIQIHNIEQEISFCNCNSYLHKCCKDWNKTKTIVVQKQCNAWRGQLGLEPTFNLFIQHLVQIFEAIKPKLREDGSMWINLGDTYSSNKNNIKEKSLIGIPDRFKIAMIDNGWICRNEIIWYKPSTMPSSAKDRFTVDFEKFFFFTKNKKYYFKQQFEPHKDVSIARLKRGVSDTHKNTAENSKTGLASHSIHKPRDNISKYKDTNYGGDETSFQRHSGYKKADGTLLYNPKGRNKRTTWSINPKGFKEAHFAVYPEALIETPIDACCPEKICIKCDKPIETNYGEDKITSCDCNAPFRRGIVLDPFNGSGTTGIVAQKQNKEYIGIEINPEYIKISKKRLDKYNYIHLNDAFYMLS